MMFDGSRLQPWKASAGASMAGPPSSGTPTRSGGTSYPGYVYSFWADDDRRCLYVGKAGAGPSGPGMRIRAHYLNGAPWALAATTIRVQAFPGLTDGALLEVERQRIEGLTPRGNKEHNWAHHDAAWVRRVELGHARAMGHPVSNLEVAAVMLATLRSWARRLARMVGQALLVDAVALAVFALVWAACF